ncbi:MAG: peptidylprolyl isomerase [Deltaproteobacteria bacterium]|jgi:parvulin-like peptidyl-prolyl isomerase|nr:peptidylprolyl isomerase [Deltaproteobacteria bacterium]
MSFSNRVVLFASFLLMVAASHAFTSDQPAETDTILAKVGNVKVTEFDRERHANSILPMKTSFHGGVSAEKIAEVKEEALEELISRAYKVQFAIDEELAIDPNELDTLWQKKLARNPSWSAASPSQLNKVKGDIYLDLLAKKAEKTAVDDKISISDQQIQAHYEANKDKFFRQKLFTASHVFVEVDPASTAEQREAKRVRAQELYNRAVNGEDFYNLAYYESDDRTKFVGGSLGSFHAGQTVAEFDDAIQKLEPGEISEPVKTMYGFHIIKLDAVEEARQLTLEEATPKIKERLFKAEREKRYSEWMATLKNKYTLERYDQ